MGDVTGLNPLANAEAELAQYFESAAGAIGFRAQNPDPDRFGGVFDEEASARLHRSKLLRSHREAVDRARLVELTISLVDAPTQRTISLAFERRGYAYRTDLGAARLWQAFRREASNVGLLGLVLETPVLADECVVAQARGSEAFDAEAEPEPPPDRLLHFLDETAARAFARWDERRAPGTSTRENDTAWMIWLPKWVTRAKHAADKRLVSALRAYEDVRQQRLEWERLRSKEEARRERERLDARLGRIIAIANGAAE